MVVHRRAAGRGIAAALVWMGCLRRHLIDETMSWFSVYYILANAEGPKTVLELEEETLEFAKLFIDPAARKLGLPRS